MSYKKIPTSPEVWAVILARHRGELKVFSSYSAPDGDGDPEQGRMCIAYGFERGDYPVIETRMTWDIEYGDSKATRKNVRHEYWLCAPVRPDA